MGKVFAWKSSTAPRPPVYSTTPTNCARSFSSNSFNFTESRSTPGFSRQPRNDQFGDCDFASQLPKRFRPTVATQSSADDNALPRDATSRRNIAAAPSGTVQPPSEDSLKHPSSYSHDHNNISRTEYTNSRRSKETILNSSHKSMSLPSKIPSKSQGQCGISIFSFFYKGRIFQILTFNYGKKLLRVTIRLTPH